MTMALSLSQRTNLLDYSAKLQGQYEARISQEKRKRKGQFFTPPEVCRFMAGLFSSQFPKTFRLLDPGAGVGALSAAVCERVRKLRSPRHLETHLFENDPLLLPLLHQNMQQCSRSLEEVGHSLSYYIHEKDFILDAAAPIFDQPSLFVAEQDGGKFHGVIMNPPYFKLSKASEYTRVMEDVVHGQPNVYAFFLAAAAQMLLPSGELIAITPRSFCNGLYFRDFRRWFFSRMSLKRVHLFESRTDTFRDVLQESLITFSRREEQASTIRISTSYGRDLVKMDCREVSSEAVLDNACGDLVVRIPATSEHSQIMNAIESWPNRFAELGLRVSTGPVVKFRARQFLSNELTGSNTVPLLSVHNVQPFNTVWPNIKKKHPTSFQVCPDSMRHLLPTRNYVLLRRFSAKEERRRLTASCIFHSEEQRPYVALENHLNYVYHADRELTVDEIYGLTALFNSALLDLYFRTISGNTQVNATDLRTMKFPGLKAVARIGKQVKALPALSPVAIERIVLRGISITGPVANYLLKETLF